MKLFRVSVCNICSDVPKRPELNLFARNYIGTLKQIGFASIDDAWTKLLGWTCTGLALVPVPVPEL